MTIEVKIVAAASNPVPAPQSTTTSTANVSDPQVNLVQADPIAGNVNASLGLVKVATFTDPGGLEAGSASLGETIYNFYRATIDWGDGSPPELGSLQVNGNTVTVLGQHTYAVPGDYNISVHIDQLNPGTTITDRQYVNQLYQDFLGRPASLAEQLHWARQLVGGAETVAAAIQRSPESVQRRVGELYQLLLGRAPDAAGLAGWSGQLLAGATLESVIAGIAGNTPEFANRANQLIGGPDAGANTIVGLYAVLLGRAPAAVSAAEVAAWRSTLNTQGPAAVALGLEASLEFRERAVRAYYGVSPLPFLPNLLHRTAASQQEIDSWAGSGLDLMTIEVNLAASGELLP